MATKTSIEWTNFSWNPVTGCSKVSPGCKNCYAERMAKRLKSMNNRNYQNGFKLTIHEHMLEVPLSWKKPRIVFVNSMSDFFHEDIPLDFIQKAIDTMRQVPQHIFQILTKRSLRMRELKNLIDFPKNVWLGVSIETNDYLFRMEHLKEMDCCVKFVSAEPLLSSLSSMDLSDIDWVIVGGESGYGARLMKKEWVDEIKNNCIKNNVPFFFKQWGGIRKKSNGRMLDGRLWNELPVIKNIPALF